MTVPETMLDLLRSSAASHGSAEALRMCDGDEHVTYEELLARVETVAAGLHAAGFRRGDSIALWLPSSIEWVVLEFAAAGLGILVVPLNTRYKPAEVAHLLGVGRADALIFSPGFHDIDFAGMVSDVLATTTDEVRARLRLLVTVGDDLPAGFDTNGRTVLRFETLMATEAIDVPWAGQPDDLVNVFGTSGTTSFPKLASQDQKTIVRHARTAARALHLGPADRMLCFLPFCGTFGFVALMATLAGGGRAVVQPVYTHDTAVEVVRTHGVTVLLSTEAIVRGMFAAPGAGPDAFATWNRGVVAGVNVRDLIDRAAAWDLTLFNVYGSSELFAVMAVWDPTDPAHVRAIPGGRLVDGDIHVRVVEPGTGEPVPEGEPGELQFSGYNVTRGYLSNEKANAAAFTADGWYRSNDRGRVLEGGRAFEYQARLADTLRLRGYLVSPGEIEEFLVSAESVAEAQVVGVRDDSTGDDRAVAFVKAAPGSSPDPEQLRAACRESLAGWKIPDVIVLVESYPTTPSANGEKVQKVRLREMAVEALLAKQG
ncbi:AMP-binding protein [Blastococcus tunisiensis]|uniref:Fatty-acyl-CoA synthase n=1 Tax=Blastococcus tunisiensis TaxID=1798228 RepID=A0A1I1ZNH6_9ACTN|nr:AMP-binding protein [Blastococcus sp. DSM 46838]SFE33246.1 fatty-acyl-CoA synthase [Blastococcus sp. DSM 46838]